MDDGALVLEMVEPYLAHDEVPVGYAIVWKGCCSESIYTIGLEIFVVEIFAVSFDTCIV